MASPCKPPPESSDQAKELAETLKNLTLRGLRFVDSFTNQVRTALSRKSEPFRPPAQVDDPQENLRDKEKLKAAQTFIAPSKSPPESSDQAKELPEILKNMALLGLRLDKDESFMNHVEIALSQKSEPFHPPAQVNNPQANLHDREKLEAAQVPVTLIRIGSWQFASVHEADLVGKFYFATRKLVWEVLVNGLKNKMEIQWSDISAIRATTEENKPGILEIELHQPPTFYKETDPQPQHHSFWISADDFTGGQALTCRRHYLEFPSAALDRNYVKLLSSDRRLHELSQSGFPSSTETTLQTPAINRTLTSLLGSRSAVGSASNSNAMGVRQEDDGYANSSGKFIGPSEQNETFTSLIGSSSAGGSASNGDAICETGT